jgi:hypothetical protein
MNSSRLHPSALRHDAHAVVSQHGDRIASVWEPGVWVGAACRAFGPVSEVVEDPNGAVLVENHSPHHIFALWRTRRGDGPFLRRWPSIVNLSSTDEKTLVAEMLQLVPARNQLWLSRGEFDWALMAEIVMVSEPSLAPWQYRELEGFVKIERARTLAQISRGYTGDAHGYKSFVDTVRDDVS